MRFFEPNVSSEDSQRECQHDDDQIECRGDDSVDSGQYERQKRGDGRCREGQRDRCGSGKEADADGDHKQIDVVQEDVSRFGAQLIDVEEQACDGTEEQKEDQP